LTFDGPYGLVFVCGDHDPVTGHDAIGVHADTACINDLFDKRLKCAERCPFNDPLPGNRRHLNLPLYAASRQWRGRVDEPQTNLVFFGLHGLNPTLAEQLSAATTQTDRMEVYMRWQLEVDDGLVAAMDGSVPTGALYVPERGFYDVEKQLLRPWVDRVLQHRGGLHNKHLVLITDVCYPEWIQVIAKMNAELAPHQSAILYQTSCRGNEVSCSGFFTEPWYQLQEPDVLRKLVSVSCCRCEHACTSS